MWAFHNLSKGVKGQPSSDKQIAGPLVDCKVDQMLVAEIRYICCASSLRQCGLEGTMRWLI